MPATVYANSGHSPTAMPGVGEDHDENVYSAVVMAHGGVTQQTIFVAGQGTPIPTITGTAITAANLPAHYLTYTPVTTCIQQAGQLGNTIGDFTARAVGITIDQAQVVAGVTRFWGATPAEVIDLCSKVRVEIKLGGKRRSLGPLWAFPQVGGAMGFTNVNNSSLVGNGLFATGRRIRTEYQIGRADLFTVEITPDAALAFSDVSFAGSHTGQASLVWVMFIGSARSDVR
jgi:hypothetical protein